MPGQSQRGKPTILLAFAVVLVLAASLLIWRRLRHADPAAAQTASVTTVKRADFVQTVRLTGTVEAVNFLAIAAPRLAGPGLGSLIITKLSPSGSHVTKGDLLA